MSRVFLDRIAAVNAEVFRSLDEKDQYVFIHGHKSSPEVLKPLYSQARGDTNKAWIVYYTKDSDLANTLFSTTKYPLVKLRVLPYVTDKAAMQAFAVNYAHNPQGVQAMVSKLRPEDSSLVLDSLKSLGLTPETAETQIHEKLTQNPITD